MLGKVTLTHTSLGYYTTLLLIYPLKIPRSLVPVRLYIFIIGVGGWDHGRSRVE
jgi:hypothetical protein